MANQDNPQDDAVEHTMHLTDAADMAEAQEHSTGLLPKLQSIWDEMLFIVVTGRRITSCIEWILIFLEDIQFVAGVFPRELGTQAGFPLPGWILFVLKPYDVSISTYVEFQTRLLLICGVLTLWYLNGIYLGYKVYQGRYAAGPLFVFRMVSVSNVLALPVLQRVFSAFDCRFFSDNGLRIVNGAFDSCSTPQHIGLQVVAAVYVVTFFALSMLYNLNFVSVDPRNMHPSARVHGRCHAVYVGVKFVWLVLTIILADFALGGIIVTFCCSALMAYLFDHYRPHYNAKANFLRFALMLSTAGFSALVGLFWLGSSATDNTTATAVIILLTVVTFVFSWTLSGWLYRKRLADIPRRLLEHEKLTGFQRDNYLVFDSWPTVEISCRAITEGMSARRRAFDPSKANQVYKIFRQGIKEFPQSAILHLLFHLYSNFINAAGCGEIYPLEETKEMNHGFDIKFFICVIEQLKSKEEHLKKLGRGIASSEARFAELKRVEMSARVNHRLANNAVMAFWRIISKTPVDKENISAVISELQDAIDRTESSYHRLLDLSPDSAEIKRAFATFLIEVKNDKDSAATHIEQAEMLEDRAAYQLRKTQDFEVGSAEEISVRVSEQRRSSLRSTSKESDGIHDKLDRPSTTSSTSSPGSSSGNRRAVMAKQMGVRGLKLERILRIQMALIFIASITLISVAFTTVQNVLDNGIDAYGYNQLLRSNSFSLARLFQTTRLMTLAGYKNDAAEFALQKGRLAEAVGNLRGSMRKTFAGRPEAVPNLIELLTEPSISEVRRTFPSNITLEDLNTLYVMTETYANKAARLLDRDPVEFTEALMARESNYKFVIENYLAMQDSMTAAESYYEQGIESNTAVIDELLWIVWAATTFAFIFATYSIDWMFRKMQKYHMQRVSMLTRIPKNLRKAVRDSYETSDSQRPNSPILDTTSTGFRFPPGFKFRLVGVFVGVISCLLCLGFREFSHTALFRVAQSTSISKPFSQLQTGSLILNLIVTELETSDTADIWLKSLSKLDYYERTLDKLKTLFDLVVYETADTTIIAMYPEAITSLWLEPSCLLGNASECAATAFVPAVSFTPNVVRSGFGSLLTQYIHAGQAVYETAKLGNYTGNYAPGIFIQVAGRDYITQGFDRFQDAFQKIFSDDIEDSRAKLLQTFVFQLLWANAGCGLVIFFLTRWFRGKDRAASSIFLLLPPHIIKSDRCLQVYFKTGEISDVPMRASDVSIDRRATRKWWGSKREAKETSEMRRPSQASARQKKPTGLASHLKGGKREKSG